MTSQFKKDFKKYQLSGRYDINKLKNIMIKLINEEPLEIKYDDHKLKGNFSDFRESHIEPDWILIYKIEDSEIIFIRTGSHSDLFD